MEGSLAGTGTELAAGTGGTGDHPAPAAMRNDAGDLVQHGEWATPGLGMAPTGDSSDQSAGDVSRETQARIAATVVDSADTQQDTDRPDIGTP